MATDNHQSQEIDLDRTDKLPILQGALVDDDVEDDAVRMDTATLAAIKHDFPRQVGVDLPSLAESVRSVEERISRQSAAYETLTRNYEKTRDAEAAAAARAQALATELAELRATLEAEQSRSRVTDKTLAEKVAAAEAARVRIDEALRETERYQAESQTLKGLLASRDASIVQALHSLSERDAQLSSLQREHAQIVPALAERSKLGTQLEADLSAARARSDVLNTDLRKALETIATLNLQLKAGEQDLGSTRRELAVMKAQTSAYMEKLRTRDWRLGFDHNVFRELDAKIGAAQEGRAGLHADRDRLRQRVAAVESELAARDETIRSLNDAAAAEAERYAKQAETLEGMDRARAELAVKLESMESERGRLNEVLATQHESIAQLKAAADADEIMRGKLEQEIKTLDVARADMFGQTGVLEGERKRLSEELKAKDAAIDEALAAGVNEAERIKASLTAAVQARAELATQVEMMQTEATRREEEMGVLVAHLQEARRPILSIEADVKRLSDELAVKASMLETLTEENRNLRLTVERTKGALEEREFLIRRLERSETNNANVLGRIQTSIERLGVSSLSPAAGGSANVSSGVAGPAVLPAGGASQAVDYTAELTRIDGQSRTSYPLVRRTRIGRAPGCELQVDSSSVSRHHALILMGKDMIIEDLNSTNGVLVNGRKVTRQLLHDGDLLTIGEAQFRLNIHLAARVIEAPATE